MPEETKRPLQITVERIGNKLTYQIDPDLITRPGGFCCCCCNVLFSAEDLARAATQTGGTTSTKA
jgi:streptolysin S family bacteriocin protoxin